MGAAELNIHGAKGGDSSPKAPVEAADSLRSTNLAKILIAVGEGEFDGAPTAANIYLDSTPINDASGNVNFTNVKWEWRTGSVDQAYIPGIPSVENETNVNVELRSDAPWVRSITNTQLSAARVRLAWPALQKQDDEGNVGGYRIEYAIDVATDGGAYQQVLIEAVDGKTTTRYERSRRIDLPTATTGWQIRVRRITANQNTNKIADTMLVAGLTEVIDAKLRYPNTALLYIEFDAEQFSNIPAVTVDCNGRKWQVPSNYDPVTRSYSGVWDGTFKLAWTNNPAWITFGICTEDRFGLGKRIKPFMVDKWELYRIAQYCDQLVPDGVGGQEPRFLCDMNLQGKAEAWGLLRDISAIYRGMTYWAQGQLVMQADMPRAQDFDYVFTRANVIDGKFSYGSASAKTRYTRAIVSYDNPANNYDTDVVAYSDPDLQRRFSDRPVEISAIGCTRASEAQRRGKWIVLSNNLDRTVSFKTGMEGAIPLPGFIIPIADSLLAGREVGGRISESVGRVVTLDRDTLAKPGDRLIVNLPSGKAEGRTVQAVAGRAVTLTTAYSEAPIPELQWVLDADDLAIPLYRVLTTKRTIEGDYEITALQYEPSKFAYIDTGARLEERPISVIPITVVPAPASVTLTATSAIDQGIAITTMTITCPAVSGAVAYDVEWRKDNGNWIKVQRTGTTSIEVRGIYSGAYLARVRAVSAFDISSIWRTSTLTQLNGKTGTPPSVTSLTTESLLFGIKITWAFPPGAEDTQRTEIWYGPANDLAAATKLADLAYPQSDYSMQQLKAGATLFFWARLVDRSGNIGPFYPVVDGVVGQASSDATAILDQIAGEVTKSALGQELLSDIEKIDGNGPGSVNDRLNEVKGALQEGLDAVDQSVSDVRTSLQEQIDAIADLADSMPYKPGQTYVAGQGVLGEDGIIYQATKNVPVETPPPNVTYWLNVGQAVTTANGLAVRVQTAETKITSIEGVNTAQANQITGVQTALDGKAESSVVQSIGSRVTVAEGTLTSHGTAITGLTNALPGKADASTVQALSNTVTQQGTDITAQGQALTNVTANLGSVGGENMLFNPSFERATSGMADGWALNGLATVSVSQVTSTLDPAGKAQRLDLTIPNASIYMDLSTGGAQEPKVSPGQIVTMSAYVRGTVGMISQLYFQWKSAAGTIISSDGATSVNLTADWQRLSRTSAAVPDGAVSVRLLYRVRGPVSGTSITGFAEWDRAQFELSPVVSGWKDNNGLTDDAITAGAAATTALTARVTQTETGLTSASANIVTLTNNLAGAGGDNLLPNSSFEQLSSDGTRPLWWRTDGSAGATISVSLVDSPLALSNKAVRNSYAGLANGGYIGMTYNIADGERPKVEGGKTYTLSTYARVSSPSARFTMYIQWLDAASTLLSTAQLPEVAIGSTTFTRMQFTATAPATAVRTQIFPARLINRSGAAADMWIEFDNVQLQEGAVATAYAPSVLLGDNAQSAATAALTSTVTQQGTTLTSLSSQVTDLSSTVNSVTDGLATKATTTALNALTTRVTNAEGVNTSQASSLTALKASITGESSPFSASTASWEFLSNLYGWTASVQAGSPTLVANPTFARMTGAGQFFKSIGIDANGTLYPYLRMRFKRSGTTRGSGRIYWANQDGGLAEARTGSFPIDITTTDWQTVEIDLSANAAWVGKTNTAIRLDVVNSGDTAGTFDMAYISIGSKSPSASALALSSTQATVTQQGTAITAQSTRIDTLSSTVGTVQAAIQSEATTRANADSSLATQISGVQATAGTAAANAQTAMSTAADVSGKASAMYSVKLAVTAGGQYYATGYGLGLENNNGVFQSQFIVAADRFAIVNVSGAAAVSPFAVQGSQTFIADAFIRDASITNAKIGDQIYSSNYVANQSGWVLRKDGIFEINSTIPGAGRVLINGNGMNVYDQNGVLRVQLGNLG
jgi:predicted phage tail protein